MPERYRKNDIPQIINRGIFFDANVLIYLFWPIPSKWIKVYSSIYYDLFRNDVKMYVDFTVISEVVNRVVSFESENYRKANNILKNSYNFKSYRNTPNGQQTVIDVYRIIKSDILGYFTITGKCFTENDINHMLSDTDIDINDKAIELICQDNNFILLTNDSDFRNSSLDILSENRDLI
jgi:predicted nucleic acid-binding protein